MLASCLAEVGSGTTFFLLFFLLLFLFHTLLEVFYSLLLYGLGTGRSSLC